MRKTLFLATLLLLIIYATIGCKRSSQYVSLVKDDSTYFQKILARNTSKMAGSYIWSGTGNQDCIGSTNGSVFIAFKIVVLDNSTIIGYSGEKLSYKSMDTTNRIITFNGSYPNGGGSNEGTFETLTYNYSNGNMTDQFNQGSSGCGAGLSVYSPAYVRNLSLKNYTAKMSGLRVWVGTFDDFFYFRSTTDSIYSINDTFALTIINDSTIVSSKDFLGFQDSVLHYKSVDNTAGTITFEACHGIADGYDTLAVIYNYTNNTMVFVEQYTRGAGMHDYVKLQSN